MKGPEGKSGIRNQSMYTNQISRLRYAALEMTERKSCALLEMTESGSCARYDRKEELRFALPWGHLPVEMTQAGAVINQKSYLRADTKRCLLRRRSGKDERDLVSEKEVGVLEGY